MTYDEWLADVPQEIQQDALWQTTVYRQALFSGDLAWADATKLAQDRRTLAIADQLYRAVGGVSTTIAEGYGRISGKDQARYYEYALGSAREARDWYFKGRYILGPEVVDHRLKLLAQIIRQLIMMVPKYRGRRIAEVTETYGSFEDDGANLLTNVPLP